MGKGKILSMDWTEGMERGGGKKEEIGLSIGSQKPRQGMADRRLVEAPSVTLKRARLLPAPICLFLLVFFYLRVFFGGRSEREKKGKKAAAVAGMGRE